MHKKKQTAGSKEAIKYQIVGTQGNAFLKFFLTPGDVVLADGGSMIYMDDTITLTTSKPKKGGGIMTALKRGLAGESLFQSYFVAGDKPTAVLALSTPLPGDIMAIHLKEGESWQLSAGSFLAATSNIQVSGTLRANGFISWGNDEGIMRTKVTAKDGDGMVWVESYGHIEKHGLKAGESLKVDNEGFLASPSGVNYTLAKATKSLIASFLTKEGIVMRFTGPATVYTQSKGVKGLVGLIAPLLPHGAHRKEINLDIFD